MNSSDEEGEGMAKLEMMLKATLKQKRVIGLKKTEDTLQAGFVFFSCHDQFHACTHVK